jgi:hypothetical protein
VRARTGESEREKGEESSRTPGNITSHSIPYARMHIALLFDLCESGKSGVERKSGSHEEKEDKD